MFDFLFTLVVLGLLVAGIGFAFERIARHIRGNPEAMKAVIEHVFVPLFARQDRTRQVTLEVVDPVEWPEEQAAKEKPSNAV
jgi:hypothetical protein